MKDNEYEGLRGPFLSFGGWGVFADGPKDEELYTLVQPDGAILGEDETMLPLENCVAGAFAYLRANVKACQGKENGRVVSGWRRGESK